jgi:hypothetical protein
MHQSCVSGSKLPTVYFPTLQKVTGEERGADFQLKTKGLRVVHFGTRTVIEIGRCAAQSRSLAQLQGAFAS